MLFLFIYLFSLIGMIFTIMQLLARGAVPSRPLSDTPESIRTTTTTPETRPLRHKQQENGAWPCRISSQCTVKMNML